MTSRSERLDTAMYAAGILIAELEEHGPLNHKQKLVLARATCRAAVPHFQDWEAKDAATRITKDLEKAKDAGPIIEGYRRVMAKRKKREVDVVVWDEGGNAD